MAVSLALRPLDEEVTEVELVGSEVDATIMNSHRGLRFYLAFQDAQDSLLHGIGLLGRGGLNV